MSVAWCLLTLPVLLAVVAAWHAAANRQDPTQPKEPSVFWLCMRRFYPLALVLTACAFWDGHPLLALVFLVGPILFYAINCIMDALDL